MGFYHRYRYSGGGGSAGPRVGEKRALRDYDVTASDLRSVRQSRNGWNGCVLYNCDDLQSIQDQKRARVEANVAFEKQKKADKAKEIEDNLLKKHGSAVAVAAFKASQAEMEAEAAAKARMMSLRMSLSLVDLSSGYKLPAGWREVSLNKTNAKKLWGLTEKEMKTVESQPPPPGKKMVWYKAGDVCDALLASSKGGHDAVEAAKKRIWPATGDVRFSELAAIEAAHPLVAIDAAAGVTEQLEAIIKDAEDRIIRLAAMPPGAPPSA